MIYHINFTGYYLIEAESSEDASDMAANDDFLLLISLILPSERAWSDSG